jgi:hypothetical protein
LAFSSFQAKEKKKNVKKGGSFPLSSHSTLSFLAPASAFLFQTLSPDIFFFSNKRKEKKKKKNHREKKCKEGRELSFKLPLYLLTFGSHLCPPFLPFCFKHFLVASFFFQARKKNKKKP